MRAAGLPPGVVNIVAAGREVSEYLVPHQGIDKVSCARYAEFAEAITAAARSLKAGDPSAEDTQIGPLISERQRGRGR